MVYTLKIGSKKNTKTLMKLKTTYWSACNCTSKKQKFYWWEWITVFSLEIVMADDQFLVVFSQSQNKKS